MDAGSSPDWPLPEHPQLREIAVAMEGAGVAGEILDAQWRMVFISSEEVRMADIPLDQVFRFLGSSQIVRNIDGAELFGVSEESGWEIWRLIAPMMRRELQPGDPDFAEVFGPLSEIAATVEPSETAPRAWHYVARYPPELGFRRSVLGDLTWFELRIDDEAGSLAGIVRLMYPAVPASLLARLGRGDRGLFERMDRVSRPARRPAGILFADLEASGDLSRRLSSRGYFDLIRGLTDLIDSSVAARTGIVGKHAGDGGSALFLSADFDGSESAAARATIEAARVIRHDAERLGVAGVPVKLNVGVHWGATLMVGQVATSGRLEVTALGDQMNEAARIEAAAKGGAILASKDILERLDPGDAQAAGVDPGAISYTPLGQIDGVSEKAIRDAGAIAVAEI